jgi:chemotaxis protein methyltransferase CheR
MNPSISDEQLSRFSHFIDETIGLHFPPPRWLDLQRGVAVAAREFGFEDVPTCMQWLMSAPLKKEQIEILAGNLTVGETYFFREQKSFEILADDILPALIHSRQDSERRLRIWSAACCTGEEPYSLAILLHQTIPELEDWHLTILATDLNPRFLCKAKAGLYGQWSFRNTPSWIKDRYFQKTADGRLEIIPEIRRMVSFARLNLVEDVYPSLATDTNAMDVIFCRNVLMYFSQLQAERVVEKLSRAQVEGGWLVVSPSESAHVRFPSYAAMNFPGVILYKKDSQNAQLTAGRAPATETEPVMAQPPDTALAEMSPPIVSRQEEQPLSADPIGQAKAAEPVLAPYAEAELLYEQGRYAEAAEKLVELVSGVPPEPQVFNLLARMYANQGKLAEALNWCDRGIAADKLNPSNHYLRAIVLQEQGALEDAAGSLRRALYLDHNFVLAHFALGNLARTAGKVQEANKHLENALRLLRRYQKEDVLPESEGITAGRLTEIITSSMSLETMA